MLGFFRFLIFGFSVGGLFIGLCGLLYAAPYRKQRPHLYDITPFQPRTISAIPLTGNTRVQLKTPLAPGNKIYFEDEIPQANWGHAGAFKIYDSSGNLVEQIPTLLPPKEMNLGANALFGGLGAEVTFSLSDLGGKFRVAHPEHFYALLINGNANQRHWNDFAFLYRVLTQVYGYNRANIFVADSVNLSKHADLDGDGSNDILFGSGVQDVFSLLATLKGQLGRSDHLLVVVNDHGLSIDGHPVLVLYDGQVKANDFGKRISEIGAGKILSIYEQCFGGGFVRPSTGAERVSISASSDQELSWANDSLTFDEFLYHIISAFAGQTHDGKAVSSGDGNRKISVQDAFSYAVAKDETPETPLMESQPNAGSSSQIGFGF